MILSSKSPRLRPDATIGLGFHFNDMKRILFFIGGVCWFLFALGFAGFLIRSINQGPDLPFLGPPSTGSILLGFVHVIGFGMAVILCFAVCVGLCARGIVREDSKNKPDDVA